MVVSTDVLKGSGEKQYDSEPWVQIRLRRSRSTIQPGCHRALGWLSSCGGVRRDTRRRCFQRRAVREKPSEDEFPAQEEPPNIHPILARRLEERSPEDRELILVNLRDDMTVPRFPEPVENEPRNSRANREVQSRSDALIGQILEHREGGYQALAQEFADRYGAEIQQTFWLLRCMLLEIPLGMVRSLAERDDVLYVEPNDAGDIPGQNANPNDDVDDGRRRIVSDPYFNLGLTGGFVGLLDTGLRFTHTLFTSPSHIAFRFDCTGGSGCSTGPGSNPNDDCWNHGTAEAAAFTGNINQGNAFRGVTGITLDSFKVFPTSFNPTTGACNGFLNVAAGVAAFQTAVSVFDRVIYGGMQGSGNYLSSLSIAADNAFDAGASSSASTATSAQLPERLIHRAMRIG
jgi:serine protease AprX